MGDVKAAVARVGKQIEGRFVYGIPHSALEDKKKLKLVAELGDTTLFADLGVDPAAYPGWLPLAKLDDEGFLVVEATGTFRVGYFDEQEQQLWPLWDSLGAFVKSLLEKKKDKTKFAGAYKALDRAEKLIEQGKTADALAIIEPVLAALPPLADPFRWDEETMSRTFDLYGRALRQRGDRAAARRAFERAVQCGLAEAEVRILDMIAEDDPAAVIGYATEILERRSFDARNRGRILRHLALARVQRGDAATAEAALRAFVDEFAIDDPKAITELHDALAKDAEAGVDGVRAFLPWIVPKSYAMTPEQAKELRAWWKSLKKPIRDCALGQIDREDDNKPTDEEIARAQDVESLELYDSDGTYNDVSVFLPFTRLLSLSFHGNPDTIEPLRALKRLESLTISDQDVPDFQWPSAALRALWKAAEAGKQAAVENALAANAAGALHARNLRGETALHLAASGHHEKLALWMVSQGADPWAGCHGEGDAFYFFDDEMQAKLEKAAAAAGIPHPSTGKWRILEAEGMPKGARFELHVDDFANGKSLAAKWPQHAKLVMTKPKTDNKLYDLMWGSYRGLVCSERVAEVLRGEPSLELLPLAIYDQASKRREETYFAVNALAVDCLDIDKCYPTYSRISKVVDEVAAFVIDDAKTNGAQIFRPKLIGAPIFVSAALGAKLAGFTGVKLAYPKR